MELTKKELRTEIENIKQELFDVNQKKVDLRKVTAKARLRQTLLGNRKLLWDASGRPTLVK